MSTTVLITPPAAAVLSLSDCKAILGITGTASDASLEPAINAVIGQLDPSANGYLGRALRPQTWEYRLSDFHGAGSIELPFPPLIAVISVVYDDPDGMAQTLVANTDYRVFGIGTFGKAWIAPAFGKSWPATRCDVESVRIRFNCGYGGTGDTDTLPAAIKSAIAAGARQLMGSSTRDLSISNENVDGVASTSYVVSENASAVIRDMTDRLLAGYRVYD